MKTWFLGVCPAPLGPSRRRRLPCQAWAACPGCLSLRRREWRSGAIMVRYERMGWWFMSCLERPIWRDESGKEAVFLPPGAIVMCGFGLPPRAVWVRAPAVATVYVDVCDSCYHWRPEDRTVQRWPFVSLAPALGRTGSASHLLPYSGERTLHLTWAAQ